MTETDTSFEELLEFVRSSRGFDFTGYKRPTLMRRFEKRMQSLRVDGWASYRAHLEDDPDEFNELFNTILINVTGFFRDRDPWTFLADDVIPKIIENKGATAPIRVWSAGCASGEEPYSIAMLLCEALGDSAFKGRVKIYATDIDDVALGQARAATYSTDRLADVPEDLRDKYFTGSDHRHAFRTDIRRAVIFGRNDLMQDPPISRVDLLVSRNTLMYFSASAQERILANFSFALSRRGFLLLGKAEALQSRTDLFQPYDLKRRFFVKNPMAETEQRPAPLAHLDLGGIEDASVVIEAAFEQAQLAQFVADSSGRVVAINHAARALFSLKPGDVGRALQDLEISYRPADLRSLIDQVRNDRRAVSIKQIEWMQPPGAEPRHLDLHVTPLTNGAGSLVGVGITFADVTRYRTLHDELEQARLELKSAYEELQSTVEELETTNEELQSTNEELETTNEELQSTNEELETMNDELRDRTDAASEASSFLSSILAGIRQSIVVVDAEFRVRAWSRAAYELWGLRPEETEGENFLNLDIGIQVSELREPIREVLRGGEAQPVELTGHDRRGESIRCTVSFAPMQSYREEVEGVILVVDAHREAQSGSR